MKVAALLIAGALALGGCVRVRPHERQTLAHPALAQPPWPDAHLVDVVLRGGGGCGCN